MIILGIDTSFDDTAAAVVENTTIRSNVLSSELPLYQEWGGVVPRLARVSHQQNIDRVIATALKRASVTWSDVDAIAVTQGPGLAIALEVGIAKAKELAAVYNKPLVPVNHMEGHLLSFLARPQSKVQAKDTKQFPLMAVLISGGHTEFVLATEVGTYTIVGEKQDDAMGEAFDKVGRMLGLGYPAGALVEKMAREGTPGAIVFPIPMLNVKNAHTSFSGLKTAAMRIVERMKQERGGTLTRQDIADIALGFQTACITHLTKKLTTALNMTGEEHKLQSLVVGGGVAANLAVRAALRRVAKMNQLPIYFPYTRKLCVDNAAMIAIAGYFISLRGKKVDIEILDRQPVMRLS